MATELAFTKGGWLHPDQMPQIRSLGAWDAIQKGECIQESMLLTIHVYGRYEVTHAPW